MYKGDAVHLFTNVSANNSSTAVLASGILFTGQWEDTESFSSISVAVKTDQDGTIYIDHSVDGINNDQSNQFFVEASESKVVKISINRKFYRVRFENNGAIAQTYFRMQTILDHSAIATQDGAQANNIQFEDKSIYDAFNRLRVSNPIGLFDAQFTYDLNPLLYEAITNGSGATITHDATNRVALMTFSSTPTGGKAFLQSFDYHPYQPGKSQKADITFNFKEAVANCMKFAGYCDGVNGVEFRLNGTTKEIAILSGTSLGDQIIPQSQWNLDRLDGTGRSGLTLDISKIQLLPIDIQALYTGNVRVGFQVGRNIVYCHEFEHANTTAFTFLQYASLPIRVGMTCTGTVSTTMHFNCCAVASEGGKEDPSALHFVPPDALITVPSGSFVHAVSIRPKLLFNGITTRQKFTVDSIDVLNTGNNPIAWYLVLGQAIITNTTFIDVNTTYAAMEYNILGVLSGSPALIIDGGYVPATNQSKTAASKNLGHKYPLTLNEAGAHRINGTFSVIFIGLGGASTARAIVSWKGIR